MPRPTVLLLLLLIVALSALSPARWAWAQEVDEGARAAEVLAAVEAADEARLTELARADEPDPWYVADELCLRGEFDAAAAFAEAASRPEVAALPAYVAARRTTPTDPAVARAFDDAVAAIGREQYQQALSTLSAADVGAGDVTAARILSARGDLFRAMRRFDEAAEAHLAAADVARDLDWFAGEALYAFFAGLDHYRGGDYAAAVAPWDRWQTALEKRERPELMATPLTNRAILLKQLDRYDEALALQRRALELAESLGEQTHVVANLVNIGNTLSSQGRVREAVDYAERGLALAEEIGHREFATNALAALASNYRELGVYDRALAYAERALEARRELVGEEGVAGELLELGNLRNALGSFDLAAEHFEQALVLYRKAGDRAGVALALANRGVLEVQRGDFSRALVLLEQALELEERLGSREGIARVSVNLGDLYDELGDHEAARVALERALALWEELGHERLAAQARTNLAALQIRRGGSEEALAALTEMLARAEASGDRVRIAHVLSNIASCHAGMDRFDEAVRYAERALETQGDAGDASDRAVKLFDIGRYHLRNGAADRALEYADRVLALSREGGSVEGQLLGLASRVFSLYRLERYEESAATARTIVDVLPLRVSGLGDRFGTQARERFANTLSVGVFAAAKADDAESALFLLEGSRAMALLEALGGRERVQGALVSESLRTAEAVARESVAAAQVRLGEARAGARLVEVKAARDALDEAHAGLREVLERIQRTQVAATGVSHPEPASLEAIQAALEPGEAWVGYESRPDIQLALVVTKSGLRGVTLDPVEVAEPPAAPDRAWDERAARLRATLIAPLELGDDVRRLVVSPSFPLSMVPFCTLVPELEVAYVPSATTLVQLRGEEADPGKGVLALGDPEYGRLRGTRAAAIHHQRLVSLPGTRAEAKAVGDVVLLGADASETRLDAALAEHEGRWRAVHLACHGFVNHEEPTLSALALTPDPNSDGALTVGEVFRSTIRADLAVLSACETGRGNVAVTEGVLGFTRAFMLAGTPRVIVSLWKVDDAATSALMQHFYLQWKDGQTSTAAALRAAQRHVASQEKWSHPYYWAAWQLWGRGD